MTGSTGSPQIAEGQIFMSIRKEMIKRVVNSRIRKSLIMDQTLWLII